MLKLNTTINATTINNNVPAVFSRTLAGKGREMGERKVRKRGF